MTVNVFNFSGGRTSAFMTENLLASGMQGVILFSNTGLEDEETLIFVQRCSERWMKVYGIPVVWIEYDRLPPKKEGKIGMPTVTVVDFNTASRRGEPFYKLFNPRKDLPNRVWRECTKHLKIKNMLRYLNREGIHDFVSYVGIRYDEPDRWKKDYDMAEEYGYEVIHPLVKWKTVKADVLKGIPEIFGFDLEIEDEIFGNCNLCFLKGPNKRLEVLRRRPHLAQFWIDMENSHKRTFIKKVTTQMLLDKASKAKSCFNLELNFDIPCTCNSD